MTPERKAEIEAELGSILGARPKAKRDVTQGLKPKIVAVGGVVVRDADVRVSAADPNALRGSGEVVSVRADYVTINMQEYECHRREEEADCREIDPLNFGYRWQCND